MGYTTLKAALDAVVKTNGRQEITGANLNGVMTQILQGVDILDRANPADTSGMNHVVLKRNKTFAEQVTSTDTIYEIRDNFSLASDFTMPKDCVLYFNGGSISGSYSITGNRTLIAGTLVDIFNGVSLVGTIVNESCNLCWWGAKSTTDAPGYDNSDIIKTALKTTIRRIYVSKIYGISSPINIASGTHEIVGDSIRNFKQCGFVANSDFSGISVTLSRDGVTYNITGMFYHSYDQLCQLNGLYINANKKANYCIEHLAGYSCAEMRDVYVENALDANILQYACENLTWERVYSWNSRIGIYIGSSALANIDKPYNVGDGKGNANLIALKNVSSLNCNYGIVIAEASNVGLVDCQTSWNSICGLLCIRSVVAVNNFYTEGDGLCRFYIDSSGVRNVSPNGESYSAPQLVSDNIDGYATIDNKNPFGQVLHLRASIWQIASNLVINSLYSSIVPRAYAMSNVTSIEQPTERNAQGVDGVTIGIGGTIIINGHKSYLSSTNDTSLAAPFCYYISMSAYSYSVAAKYVVTNPEIRTTTTLFYANAIEYTPGLAANRSVLSEIKRDIPADYNIMGGLKCGSIANRFDWRRYGFRGLYRGVPLYEYTSSGVMYLYLTKAEITEKFGNEKQVLMRLVAKVISAGTYKIKVTARFMSSSYALVAIAGETSGTSKSLSAGYYEIFTKVNLVYNASEWEYLFVEVDIDNRTNIYTSEALFYKNGCSITPPSYDSYTLDKGTTAKRPLLPNAGQKYFDTTLGKEIVFNGTDWVNMDGTALA